MAGSTSKRRHSTKYDFTIKAKGTSTRILEISSDIVRIESTEKGVVTGKFYSGTHWDTVEATMMANGTATLAVKYMHMTNKGENIVGTGTATQEAPNRKGVAKVKGEGTTWTSAPRLSKINGARWVVEGEADIIKETVKIMGNFEAMNQ
jgi:hypothetical protein